VSEQRLFSASDLARYLSVSEASVRRMAKRGDLPKPIRLPGFDGLRWDRAAIDRYLDKITTSSGYANPDEAWGGNHGEAA